MAAVMTTAVPPDWLIMKKVAIPAEIAFIAFFVKQGQGLFNHFLLLHQTQTKKSENP